MLLATAIQMSLEARSSCSSGSSILGLQAQSRLETLLSVTTEIPKYWPSVEAAYRLFRDLLCNMKSEMERSLAASDLLTIGGQRILGSQADRVPTNNTQGTFFANHVGLFEQDWNGLLGT